RQHPGPGVVSDPGGPLLVEGAGSPEPEAAPDLGRLQPARESSDSAPASPASPSERALLRQAPEVRAVCGNSACTDLRGGLGATPVPTATAELVGGVGAGVPGQCTASGLFQTLAGLRRSSRSARSAVRLSGEGTHETDRQ